MTVDDLYRRRRRRLRFRVHLAGSAIRRRGHADLHLGHHGQSEGRRDDARQPAVPGVRRRRGARCQVRRPHHVVPADGAHRRPDGRAVPARRCSAPRSPRSPTPGPSRVRCPTCGRRSGARCRGCGRSSRPQSNSRRRTNPTRRSEWGCSGGWRWPRRRPMRWSPANPVPDDVAAEWAQADELVLSKLREKLGLDQVRQAVSGAAPIPKETLAFFLGLGIPICRGLGHVGAELRRDGRVIHRDARLGTVGKLVPGHGGPHRRGRRVPGPRAAGDEGLSQGAAEDGRGRRRRRLAAHRRHPGGRRGRLPEGRRPQEGADHQRGGQEHVACQHREHHQGRVPARSA